MNTGIDEKEQKFDHDMRQLHATAVSSLSPQTLARLRAARHAAQAAPRRGHAWRWVTATALSAVLAVGLGVQLLPGSGPATEAPPMAAASSDAGYTETLATLDESPDLYVWLASSEAAPLAME
ncbi:hypothetical protein DT603_14820 [Pseudoxanthomonas gei]|uniref:Uncharacterized protein n=1 Tax=Pseudoxanthomonas gei TaxID=1383030 RepID=A0ABX0AES2_9GAMM|nr:hypothetical protein [Pseudoxanthomonas gei]NDK40114.1 hypothetical protein [Pseudoxanthomonas gei]